jgi:hypothetical protein
MNHWTHDGSDGLDGYDGSKEGTQLADCLDRLEKHFREFVYLIQEDDYPKLALWTFHTHVADVTYTSPRLLLESPLPGSGKTTVLEHLNKLCRNAHLIASAPTPALISRILNDDIHTLLLDEAHNTLNPDKPGMSDLVAIINSGYKKGATRPVLVPSKGGSWESADMPTYGPVVIAGNNPRLADDTRQRCISIRLLRDTRERVSESDWELIEPDTLDLLTYVQETAELTRQLIKDCQPVLPDGCKNRDRERWKPLARIATVAGGRWEANAAGLIGRDLERARMENESTGNQLPPAVQLVTDLGEIFTPGTRFLATSVILETLIRKNPEHWGWKSPFGKDLTAQRMGKMLVQFSIYSSKDGDTRGYYTSPFVNAWEALGIREPSKPSEPSEPSEPLTE